MAKVTIEEISRRTGLSRGTVSRAMNNRPDISEKTKQRVLALCRKLNYVPSRAARSLATGKNYAVAVVLSDLHAGFSADYLAGAVQQAAKSRYAVNIVHIGEDAAAQTAALQTLSRETIDATLLAAPLSPRAADLVRKSFAGETIVTSFPLEGIACDMISPDSAEAGRLAARHLCKDAGQDEVLYVCNSAVLGADERRGGFQSECQSRGLDPETITVRLKSTGDNSGESLEELTERIAKASRIAASDDLTAIGIMMICLRQGRTPGENVAVMGQGNEPAGRAVTPGLTTVDLNGREVGSRAMQVLLARVDQTRLDAAQKVEVAPRLIVRQSTRFLA